MTRNDEVVGPRGLSRTSVSPCACQSLQRRLNSSAVRWCFTRPRQAIFFSPSPVTAPPCRKRSDWRRCDPVGLRACV